MSSSKYLGVILAAGHGSRMGPFGEQVPKPIAPICNKPLLVYQLEHLKSLGITDVIIVIGHLGHVITQVLGDGTAHGVRIRYVEQQQRLGLAHAVGQLERYVDRPFVLFLGDLYFQFNELPRLIEEFETHKPAAVLSVKEESDVNEVKKNFSVALHDDGTVRRVIEKPRYVSSMLKGCGLYLFDLPIFDAIRRTPRTAMRDEYELTDSIQILLDYEYPVRAAAVVEYDMNLTFIRDLITCCGMELERRGTAQLVGEHCTIDPGVTLLHTVLGDRVKITKPARLERCVVMPGVTLDDGHDYVDTVITPHARLHAKHS
ncbi:MAG: NTP transferase domain-containing protein [Candidatus Hydrogenedens sp.]|nr:NTP transferase domain-containing protein [Candidatus Hydrogenedens sp.]